MNNVIGMRVPCDGGGARETHRCNTNSMDENTGAPTEIGAVALRTHSFLAYETGGPHVIDPLALGLRRAALPRAERNDMYFRHIEEIGGVVRGLETGGCIGRSTIAAPSNGIGQHRRGSRLTVRDDYRAEDRAPMIAEATSGVGGDGEDAGQRDTISSRNGSRAPRCCKDLANLMPLLLDGSRPTSR